MLYGSFIMHNLTQRCHPLYTIHTLTLYSSLINFIMINFSSMRLVKNQQHLFSRRYSIRLQSSNIACSSSQQLRGHANLSLDTDIYIFLNYCYWVCKHTQIPFFHLIVPLKSVRSLQSLLLLRRHCVHVVVDYADTVSA